jgi:peptidoglycan hydrolase CwlO-like protein
LFINELQELKRSTLNFRRLFAVTSLQEYVTSNDAEVDELRAEIEAKDARISALEAKLAEQSDSQNARLAAIEQILSKGGE